MKIDVGMYVRTKHYGIFKILKIIKERDKLWFLRKPGHQVFISDKNNLIEEEIIGELSFKLGELLEVGDFIDHHYIAEIKGTTIYTYSGWFIDFDDVEDLVSRILTHEQFESYSYEVGE